MLKRIRSIIRRIFKITPTHISASFIILFLFLFTLGELDFTSKTDSGFWAFIQRQAHDLRMNVRGTRDIESKVAVISIDEKTLATIGRFPFSRKIYAQLITKLQEYKAKVVAFDIVFAEKEHSQVLKALQGIYDQFPKSLSTNAEALKYKNLVYSAINQESDDKIFSDAISPRPKVMLGYYFQNFGPQRLYPGVRFTSLNQAPPTSLQSTLHRNFGTDASLAKSYEIEMYVGAGPIFPIEQIFQNKNVGVGFFNHSPDSDGVNRKTPVLAFFEDRIYLSLSTASIMEYFDGDYQFVYDSDGLHKEIIFNANNTNKKYSKLSMPMDSVARTWINPAGPSRTIDYYEFIDLLEGNVDKNALAGKIVFVGATATALKDQRATSLDQVFPGVEIHANIANNVLNQTVFQRVENYTSIALLMLIVGAILVTILLVRLPPLIAVTITCTLISVLLIMDYNIFFINDILFPIEYPIVQYTCLLIALSVFRLLETEEEKKYIREAFSHYVSGNIVSEMLDDPDKLTLGGSKQEMSVLFADIKNFTSIAEKLDAQELSDFLNYYFSKMTNVILKNGGTFDKYIGDEIMSFWGAPLRQSRHAANACRTALGMCAELKKINSQTEELLGRQLDIRIGINSGVMSVGNMGSEQIFDYTVLGDNANLGSRIEGVNKNYRTTILVGPGTFEQTKGLFRYRDIDCVRVVGREDPVELYELLGEGKSSESEMEWLIAYSRARGFYCSQKWEEAKELFLYCLAMNPRDYAAEVFLKRIEEDSQRELPKGWNGVFDLKYK